MQVCHDEQREITLKSFVMANFIFMWYNFVSTDSYFLFSGREDESISLPMLRDFQGPYPDAANWTIDDVVNFFKSAGFVSQAEAFREQVSFSMKSLGVYMYICSYMCLNMCVQVCNGV